MEVEKEKRSAKECCPMCGSTDESREQVAIDGDYFSVTYKCKKCGLLYTIDYIAEYQGFSLGDAYWDKDGNQITEDE